MTTKATKKRTSPKAGAVKVTEAPDCAASAGCESQAAKGKFLPGYPFDENGNEIPMDEHGRPIHVELPLQPVSILGSPDAKDEVIARLDRIIALLEGTVTVEKKGIDFDTPAWARFIK